MEKFELVKQRQAIETIARNANSQCQLIDDLLEVSRIITGKFDWILPRASYNQLSKPQLKAFVPTAEAKGVRLHLNFEPNVGLVLGDRERLQQVVWNLLSNAVKFTPGGGEVNVKLLCINSLAAKSNRTLPVIIRDTQANHRSADTVN